MRLEIDGRSYPFFELQTRVERFDLLAWLAAQTVYPKVYWKQRGSPFARAALGNLLSFPYLPSFSQNNPDVRLYGGMQFAKKTHFDETWQGFPSTCFWLPQIEVTDEGNVSFYSLDSSEELLDIQFQPPPLAKTDFGVLERKDYPDREGWEKSVSSALAAFASGALHKLVLARRSSFFFHRQLSPWHLLAELRERTLNTTLFAFQLSPTLCFFGATPEKLFSREGSALSTDAVAATRPRGKTEEEDAQLERELLSGPKEQREFLIVREFLERTLAPFSEKIQWNAQDRIVKNSHVQHLYNGLSAQLKQGIGDAQILRALHPTPALGGFPQAKSLSLLNQLEPFDRGWYGAPVGTLSPQGANLYVAIRSGLIRNRSLHLFAGTGLVPGSAPDEEWNELEDKIRPFTELFT